MVSFPRPFSPWPTRSSTFIAPAGTHTRSLAHSPAYLLLLCKGHATHRSSTTGLLWKLRSKSSYTYCWESSSSLPSPPPPQRPVMGSRRQAKRTHPHRRSYPKTLLEATLGRTYESICQTRQNHSFSMWWIFRTNKDFHYEARTDSDPRQYYTFGVKATGRFGTDAILLWTGPGFWLQVLHQIPVKIGWKKSHVEKLSDQFVEVFSHLNRTVLLTDLVTRGEGDHYCRGESQESDYKADCRLSTGISKQDW